ncbi:sulfatase-like hydrolase/transferase [Candidatus Latescibacterota bacterium]
MRGDRPNVLVIMTDQQKATASHLYGNPFCHTPSMARLAERGVLYEHAFTPHPLCVPARISFWTSQYPHSHGGRRNETLMPAGAAHAFQLWREAGYHTGLIGKNHCFERPEDLALFDTWCEISHGGLADGAATRGMEWFRPEAGIRATHQMRRQLQPQNPRFAYGTSDFPLEDYSTGLIAGQTVRFLEKHRHDPFTLWVSFPDPHEPWVAPTEHASRFAPDSVEMPPWREGEFGDESGAPERNRVLYHMLGVRDDRLEELYGLMASYYGMVRFVDDGLGQILDALEQLDLAEETIVVFCADHGDFMGEHAMQCKGGVFYDCLTRIPLILSWAGQTPSGLRDDSMVSLIDVLPTILELQGLETPATMHGRALPSAPGRTRQEEGGAWDAVFSEYGAGGPAFGMADLEKMERPLGRRALIQSLRWREAEGRRKMVRTREWKYVHDPMGDRDELYHLAADPWELENVAGEGQYSDVLARMQLRLADWSIGTEDSRPVPLP